MDMGVVIHARIRVSAISSHAMKNHKFGDINLIVADSDSMVRQGLKAAFFDDGFCNTRYTSNTPTLGAPPHNNTIYPIISYNQPQHIYHNQTKQHTPAPNLSAPLSPAGQHPRLLPARSRALNNAPHVQGGRVTPDPGSAAFPR